MKISVRELKRIVREAAGDPNLNAWNDSTAAAESLGLVQQVNRLRAAAESLRKQAAKFSADLAAAIPAEEQGGEVARDVHSSLDELRRSVSRALSAIAYVSEIAGELE